MMQFIGIDVSKDKLDVLWLREPQHNKIKTKVFANTPNHHPQLVTWLTTVTGAAPGDIRVVLEATSVYHEAVALALYDAGFAVSVVNPARVHSYAQALGKTHKTDKQDSHVLARYGMNEAPSLWHPEAAEIRELKALLSRLAALEKDLQREHNRREKAEIAQTPEPVKASIEAVCQVLEEEKQRLEGMIDDHIDRHPKLRGDRGLLESIPGVGPVVSRLMLSVLHSRDFASGSQVAAYLGLVPQLKQSGKWKGQTRLSKRGPGWIRAKLYMAAVVASQWNPEIQRQRARLLGRGKTKMQALGAAMRKLVHQCYGVVKQQTEYRPQAL